jgi:TonB family protein
MPESQASTSLPSAAGILRPTPPLSFEADFADLAARFAAKSGGGLSAELSSELALEIVLNEIVEQACQSTGATGAAIVLERDGEMICRASGGLTAPELGSRLDTLSGLSGECLQTRRTQWCDDTRTDPRPDAEASERLGIRSVVVMPLLRGNELVGVFELFSDQPYAFGIRDERALEILADRTLTNLEHASQPIELEQIDAHSDLPENPSQIHERQNLDPDRVDRDQIGQKTAESLPVEQKVYAQQSPAVLVPQFPKLESDYAEAELSFASSTRPTAQGIDYLTWMLAAAVVTAAVLLGMALGQHLVFKQANAPARPQAPVRSASDQSRPATATSTKTETVLAEETMSNRTDDEKTSLPVHPASQISNEPERVPPGGLLVIEDGKEVFRLPPTKNEAGNTRGQMVEPAAQIDEDSEHVVQLPSTSAQQELLRRVEPVYPELARQQNIQGPVLLEVHIRADGSVEDVQVVSGAPLLAEASVDAVKQWKFRPYLSNGHPLEMETQVTLDFRLPQ